MQAQENLLRGLPVNLLGNPIATQGEFPLLVDNQIAGQEIVPIATWLHGLASRKPLERELDFVRGSLEQWIKQRAQFHRGVIQTVAGAASCVVFGVVLTLILNRRRAHNALRKQINRDLHDSLGSKVAAIAFSSEYISLATQDPEILRRNQSIQRSAKGMHSALRDVLWFTDTDTDTLSSLMTHLTQIACQLVDSTRLNLQAPRRRTCRRGRCPQGPSGTSSTS
ncbi:MAG: hypothetical protein HC901_02795, partial [Bdellovibrionaceae bacterium]|nr:hypothetical protein [Pseudobdellovibrionaceae bacterium]